MGAIATICIKQEVSASVRITADFNFHPVQEVLGLITIVMCVLFSTFIGPRNYKGNGAAVLLFCRVFLVNEDLP